MNYINSINISNNSNDDNINKTYIKDIILKRLLGIFIIIILGSSLYIFLGLNKPISLIIMFIVSFFLIKNIQINKYETDYY